MLGGKNDFRENVHFQSKFDSLIVKACSFFIRAYSLTHDLIFFFILQIHSSVVRVGEQ